MGEPPVFAVVEQGPAAVHDAGARQPREADPDRTQVLPRERQSAARRRRFPKGLAVTERRAMAASYITGQDNPWFAKAYINRDLVRADG